MRIGLFVFLMRQSEFWLAAISMESIDIKAKDIGLVRKLTHSAVGLTFVTVYNMDMDAKSVLIESFDLWLRKKKKRQWLEHWLPD
jgi:hypothetical protein